MPSGLALALALLLLPLPSSRARSDAALSPDAALEGLTPARRFPRQAARRRAQESERCRPGDTVDPTAALRRALVVMGVRAAAGHVLHFRAAAAGLAREQSDRWYPPYFRAFYDREYWIDATSGHERVGFDLLWPIGDIPHMVMLQAHDASYLVRDTTLLPSPTRNPTTRLLDPWAVTLDWSSDPSVRYLEECRYRDYWRTVLERGSGRDAQRLYLDPGSGYPVKLQLDEPHYLWGQLRVEYLYSTWITTPDGAASYPAAAFRLEDGETVQSQTVAGSTLTLMARAEAPSLDMPDSVPAGSSPATSGRTLLDQTPDTVRVGERTFLLVNRAYTETVTLQGDTVYLFDATSGEVRSRADSSWIARLFPGRHAVTVVVTDVAWPHVAGVRFWVARGARIVTHEASGPFLRRVTARRWTRAPDALEKSSAPRGADLRMTTVSDSLSLAGGRVRLYPIDGIASEGALMAWIPGDRYLWASDFVQTVDEATEYAHEVYDATRRVGILPDRLAAEHLPLTPWEKLLQVVSHRGTARAPERPNP